MIRKLKFIFVLLFSITLQSQVCSDFPEITATSTTICSGLSTTLSVTYTPPTICNMNITPTTIPLGNPIPGFTYGGLYNGHHYYVHNTPTSWTQGELLCRQNGGYLVCINDINENAFVSNLTNNNIWIGLFRDPTTCQFRWLDCMDINFTNWRPGEPNSGPCGEPYTQIIRGCSFGLNTWNNLNDNAANNGSCYSNMVPIMEIDPIIYNNPISTTTTYLWSNGDTSNSISISPTSATNYWVDITSGSLTCRKNITINVNPDTPAPTGNPTQIFCTTPTPSISDLTATGTAIQWYAAATGGTALATTTTLVSGTTYYASQTVNGCESTTRFEVTVTLNDPEITASATTVCSGTAVTLSIDNYLLSNIENYSFFGEFDGHSYYLSINPINYYSALNYNLINGVDFLTITSQNENDFITSNSLPGFLWLGCSDLSVEGQWEWINNENFNYSNWDSGEPSNQSGGEDYAEFKTTGFWNDIPTIDNGNDVLRYHMFETTFTSSILWSTGETTATINSTPTATTTYWCDVTVNGVTCRKEVTITVTPNVTPAFTPVAAICSGATLSALPTTSNNGFTGTWSPALNNTATTTYTFTPTAGQCATTATMTITVNPNITPTFTQVAAICSGETLSALPTTSNNGFTGTWSPALNNTATTTYTFTPTAGQCATAATMTININPLPLNPTGNSNQSFCAIDNPTVSDLIVNGSSILWYQSASGGSPLSLNFDLIDGMTLYASSIDMITNCENPSRFPVNIQVENPALPSIVSEQVFCLENNLTIADINTNGILINWYDSFVGGNLVPLTQLLIDGDIYYGASVSSISGCESTTRIPIEITIIDSNLSFFNLITIDNNDLNKELLIQGIEQFPNNNIEVYNRYGNLVWSGINYNNVTNTFKGMANVSGVVSKGSYLPTGTYFFILSYPNDCGKTGLKGFIHINNKL
jgi:hypothetical protein